MLLLRCSPHTLLLFNSSSCFINPLVAVQGAPITIGITVTFMFHSFSFLLQSWGTSLSFCFFQLISYGQPEQQSPLISKVYHYFLFTPWEFFTSVLADVFSLEFEWQQSPQVPRTLLSILVVLNNVVVWKVSTRSPTSKSSSPFNNPLVTVPKAPITIGIIITFRIYSCFQFPSKVETLILFFPFLQFYSVVSRDSKVDNFASSLFSVDYIRSGFLAEIRWSFFMSKFYRS